jgi:polyvinyl alcohol dehydrogenase (cytochrome)
VVSVVAIAAGACGGGEDRPTPVAEGPLAGAGECDWPMWGHNPSRTFAYPCPTGISPSTVGGLQLEWFARTDDVVTATPAVVDGRLYVGDWSGRFYALDAATGEQIWTFQAATEPNVYAGNIVSSAAVTDLDGTPVVVFASGRTLYALDAADGRPRWSHTVGTDDPQDFSEIQSSPVVADGAVVVGFDAHNRPDQRAGVIAVDLRTGERRWYFDPEQGREALGCGGVWSSPSVDLERRTVFVGTANCPTSPEGWGPYTEALIALDLDDGTPRWSYQPHEPNNDDLDFAGAPNLFRAGGRDLVGLGNKDGTYYAVDRDTGDLAWKARATGPGIEEPGVNFSTGGFIGPTAYSEGIVAGGTAVGPPPFVHAIDAATGRILWQDRSVQAIYGPATIANGVLFVGNNDFTFRAYDLRSGDKLWEHPLRGVGAGGAAVVGDSLYTVSGIRQPGLEGRSETSGVYKFSLPRPGVTFAPDTIPPTTVGERVRDVRLEPDVQRCVGTPCDLFDVGITLRPPPEGLDPSATLRITTDPFTVRVDASGLGRPEQWLEPETPAAATGATVFSLFISERDDNPVGGLLCVLDDNGSCTADSLPRMAPAYNRISLLAMPAADAPLPSPADGVARLIVTVSFDPPLRPVPR